jgi:ferrous iron transport protein A
MTLAELQPGVRAKVVRVNEQRGIVLRLMEMGLTTGAPVSVMKVAPLGDPMELLVRGYRLSIRKSEARHFEVESEGGPS